MATTITLTGGGVSMNQPAAGETIQATDFNSMRTNVDRLKGTPTAFGAANRYGLGQGGSTETAATAGTTTVKETGTAGAFKDLQDEIQELQTFLAQNTETVTDVASGDVIYASSWATAAAAIEDCWNGRLNHTPSAAANGTSWTGTGPANTTHTRTFQFDFGSENNAMAFFNGGGRIGVGNMSVAGTDAHNTAWNGMLSGLGDLLISYATYYNLTTSETTLANQSLTGAYSNDGVTVTVKKGNSAGTDTTGRYVTFYVKLTDGVDGVAGYDESVGSVTIYGRKRLPNTTNTTFSFTNPSNTAT